VAADAAAGDSAVAGGGGTSKGSSKAGGKKAGGGKKQSVQSGGQRDLFGGIAKAHSQGRGRGSNNTIYQKMVLQGLTQRVHRYEWQQGESLRPAP
jgi:hypothetical protein